jgi:valyl-tRNA synthetase
VADTAVERDFGTGAVKVTPGHDATDFEIGERQHLEIRNILHPDGRMKIPEVPALDGLPIAEARARIVEILRAEGALEKIDPYHHSVGHCDRCGAVIEPLVSDQWWVKMKPLAGPAIAAAEGGEIGFHPDRWKEQYLRWMRNIRDWNISRQIWLGHRIPVWTCANGHQLAYLNDPTACSQCGDGQLTQDPDVLDTWFSSALWPFVTLGWPKDTDDLRRYYPTQVLDTGRDILYLWVARMIFMSLHFTKRIPFSEVLIHGNVLDGEGRRMSKSLGNGVDPLVMIDRYGADATRAWCGYNGTTGQDIRFFEDKIKGYQFFANKLWNAARLVLSKLPPAPLPALEVARLEPADRWILGRLSQLTAQVTRAFQQFEFGPAVQGIYDFIWHEFADDYLELIKARSDAMALSVAARVLEQTLRLLHPIMPFITEELWQRLPHQGETIMYAPWPEPEPALEDEGVLAEMAHLLDVVQKIRNLRQESAAGVGRARASLTSTHPLLGQPVGQRYVATLAQLDLDGTRTLKADRRIVVGETQVAIELPQASGPHERARLSRELEVKEREIDALRQKLQNPGFTSKAPKDVIEKERARLARAEAATERLRRLLDELR